MVKNQVITLSEDETCAVFDCSKRVNFNEPDILRLINQIPNCIINTMITMNSHDVQYKTSLVDMDAAGYFLSYHYDNADMRKRSLTLRKYSTTTQYCDTEFEDLRQGFYHIRDKALNNGDSDAADIISCVLAEYRSGTILTREVKVRRYDYTIMFPNEDNMFYMITRFGTSTTNEDTAMIREIHFLNEDESCDKEMFVKFVRMLTDIEELDRMAASRVCTDTAKTGSEIFDNIDDNDDTRDSEKVSTKQETPFDKVDEKTSKKIQTRVFRRFLAIINNDPNSVEMYLTPRGEICAVTPKLGIGDIYEMFEDIGIDIATATDFTAKAAKHLTLDWSDARNLYNILDDILVEDGRSDLEVFGERGISFERLYDAIVGDVYDNKTIEREEEKELEQEEQEEKKAVECERERDREIYRSR